VAAETVADLDLKLLRRLANCMFRAEFAGASAKPTPDERKAAWAEQRADYLKRARRLYRALERDGVALSAAPAK
jgi:hypothetical protein